nr:hypothetical protein [uncultured Porphyromonas sp.]
MQSPQPPAKQETRGSVIYSIGKTSTVGYSYEQSLAERDGAFLGLVIDWVNQPELTDSRLSAWLEQLHSELAQ